MTLSSSISTLNDPQRRGVTRYRGPCLLIAGAGTGKTRVLTYRIAKMLSDGVAADKIVALTFTNKAAKEMRERIHHLVGSGASKLHTGTFHSFCLNLLRGVYHQRGQKSLRILLPADCKNLIRKALEDKGWLGDYKIEYLMENISFIKNNLIYSEEDLAACDRFVPYYDIHSLFSIFQLYQKQMSIFQCIDFDDCIYQLVELMRHDDVLQDLPQRFQYILVDEFQDTNLAQLEVISFLCKSHRNICVVGDDDQSIYSWRGALPGIISQFEEIFPERDLIILDQNYRCTQKILDVANAVIKNNLYRKPKKLWSDRQLLHPIPFHEFISDEDEARFIADRIFTMLARGLKPKDFAILYRTNNRARVLEVALREYAIPYKVFGGQSLFEKKETRDILAFIRFIFDPADDFSLSRIINTPPRGIGIRNLEQLSNTARSQSLPFFYAIPHWRESLNGKVQKDLDNLLLIRDQLESWFYDSTPTFEQFGVRLLEAFDYTTELRRLHPMDAQVQQKRKYLGSFFKQLEASFLEAFANSKSEVKKIVIPSKKKILAWLDQFSLDGRPMGEEDDKNYVSLMTVHASKGLEFPSVFVCGLEEGGFPHKREEEFTPSALQEERRLFYVAMTRAKNDLFLTRAKKCNVNGKDIVRTTSRFIEEIPAELLTRSTQIDEEGTPQTEEEKKKRTMSKLRSLRDGLKEQSK